MRRDGCRHRVEPDKLTISSSSPRIISEVEDMVEVLAVAFRRMRAKWAGV